MFPISQPMNQTLQMPLIKRNMEVVVNPPMPSDIVDSTIHGGFVIYLDRMGERYYARQECLAS